MNTVHVLGLALIGMMSAACQVGNSQIPLADAPAQEAIEINPFALQLGEIADQYVLAKDNFDWSNAGATKMCSGNSAYVEASGRLYGETGSFARKGQQNLPIFIVYSITEFADAEAAEAFIDLVRNKERVCYMVGPVEIEVLGNIEELGVSHVVYRDSEGPAALMLAHGATTINLWAPPMDGGLDANLIEIAKAQIAWLDQIANQ